MIRPHKNLDVWKLSMQLAADIYSATTTFPNSEKYGLVAQMRNCAVSIPSNLAEGAARRSAKDYGRFITISRSSLSELDTQLDLSERLDFIASSQRAALDEQLIRIDKMLHFLLESISKSKTRA